MENNYPNQNNGPEIMEWFAREQKRRDLERQQVRSLESQQGQGEREYSTGKNVRERKKNITISKLNLIGVPLSIAFISAAMMGAYDVAQDIVQHNHGAKYNYENLVEMGNMPENLKIRYLLEVDRYNVSYRLRNGESVKRENVDIQSFVNDICTSALDNGATIEEMATGFSYAGLEDGMVKKLLNVTSEQIDQCELESYQQWTQDVSDEKGRSL